MVALDENSTSKDVPAPARGYGINSPSVYESWESAEIFWNSSGLIGKESNDKWSQQHLEYIDETGIQLEHKPCKITASRSRGSKSVQSRTSGNRETVTVVAVINAAGRAIPLQIIVKGVTKRALNSFDMTSAPSNSTWSVSDSGWTKQGIAYLWFTESFIPSIGPDRPQLLIIDGQDSHNFVMTLPVPTTLVSLNYLRIAHTGYNQWQDLIWATEKCL